MLSHSTTKTKDFYCTLFDYSLKKHQLHLLVQPSS